MPERDRAESPAQAAGNGSERDASGVPAQDAPSPEGPFPASGEWVSLDSRVVEYWRISNSLSFAVTLAIALAGGGALWIFTPTPAPVILGAWAFLLIVAYLEIFWFPRRKYQEMGYRLAVDHLEYRLGVFWKVSVMIPLDRSQHVDLQDGPLERRFGLTTLEVFTAGTRNASHEIPGLAAATGRQLRQHLVRAADLGQG